MLNKAAMLETGTLVQTPLLSRPGRLTATQTQPTQREDTPDSVQFQDSAPVQSTRMPSDTITANMQSPFKTVEHTAQAHDPDLIHGPTAGADRNRCAKPQHAESEQAEAVASGIVGAAHCSSSASFVQSQPLPETLHNPQENVVSACMYITWTCQILTKLHLGHAGHVSYSCAPNVSSAFACCFAHQGIFRLHCAFGSQIAGPDAATMKVIGRIWRI